MSGKHSILLASLGVSLLLGVFFGSGMFTFITARGYSYMSDDPAVCVNCHVMRDQYDGWRHGSHHAVASCNDCHIPHDNLVRSFLISFNN